MFIDRDMTSLAATPEAMQKTDIDALLGKAIGYGASDAALVVPAEIRVQERLAALCEKPGCLFYGQSASCPPHVGGPNIFRGWLKEALLAIVVRIDVPVNILFSSARNEVLEVLHGTVSKVEGDAKSFGYTKSRAFAGGSCKEIFCSSQASCSSLTSEKGCRHPDIARPSMSGFGVDVGHLMTLADWKDKQLLQTAPDGQKISWIAGLVLIG